MKACDQREQQGGELYTSDKSGSVGADMQVNIYIYIYIKRQIKVKTNVIFKTQEGGAIGRQIMQEKTKRDLRD